MIRNPLVAAASTALLAATQAAALPRDLKARLDAFSTSGEGRTLEAGVVFVPLDGEGERGPSAVAAGQDTPLVPASVAKLVTTVCALEALGPRWTFHTQLWTSCPPVDGVLDGDLIVRGSGDPFLVTERLWLLAHEASRTGLREVRGRLLVDASLFAPEEADSARLVREVSTRPYAARLSPLAVNFNAASLRIEAGEGAGAPGRVTPEPLPTAYLSIVNRLRTAGADTPADWSLALVPADSVPTEDAAIEAAVVEGRIPAGSEPVLEYASVRHPLEFSAAMLRAFLEEAGIEITGPTAPGIVGERAELLLDFPSPALDELIASMNRHSNNLMADMIAMAISTQGPVDWGWDATTPVGMIPIPASLTAGAEVMTEWLHRVLDAPPGVVLHDGSGLSPGNRLTARTLGRLLERAWSDFEVQPSLLSALPGPGEDGTLKRRFASGGPVPNLRAKSGTLGDARASSLAGYLDHPDLGPVAFAILMNGAPGSSWSITEMQALQEEWIRLYLKDGQEDPEATPHHRMKKRGRP